MNNSVVKAGEAASGSLVYIYFTIRVALSRNFSTRDMYAMTVLQAATLYESTFLLYAYGAKIVLFPWILRFIFV